MSLEQTQQTIDRYFHVMSGGGDLAECYTTDVTWTMTDTGEEVRGVSSVRDYVVALHNNMFDGLSSPMGTPILRATVSRRPAEPVAGSTTASHTTWSMTESQRCAATVRSLLRLHSSPAILT